MNELVLLFILGLILLTCCELMIDRAWSRWGVQLEEGGYLPHGFAIGWVTRHPQNKRFIYLPLPQATLMPDVETGGEAWHVRYCMWIIGEKPPLKSYGRCGWRRYEYAR